MASSRRDAYSDQIREISDSEKQRLQYQESRLLTPFKQKKLNEEARKNWDKFFMRNETRFFKDRHWTSEEFREICSDLDWTKPMVLLEAGCGVGNLLFPFLEAFPNVTFAYACDFSDRAVRMVKENPAYDSNRCSAFVCDLTADQCFSDTVPESSVDFCTMIFVLSAIPPSKMAVAISNIYRALKPNGCVIVRDYGLFDHSMIRFDAGQKFSDGGYARQDGTRTFYFTIEALKTLFCEASFESSFTSYINAETINRKENLNVPRVFIQGRFIKR